jgi:ParB family chromosome partitioning protein
VPKRGLPETIRMRHDSHYVEALNASAGAPLGRLVPIDLIDPNPAQPRQLMGDLTELIASIKEKGVIEPLVARQRGGRFQIVAGERRYQAAVQLGLPDLPVVIRDADDAEVIEIALIENLQRKDLTPFEEADALHALAQRCGYTHEELASRLGKSRTAVTEALSLTKIPEQVRKLCRLADISSKSLLLEIVRQGEPSKMVALIEKMTTRKNTTRAAVRLEKSVTKKGRPRLFVFQYHPSTKAFNLKLRFRKPQVAPDEIIAALETILVELRAQRQQ